MSVQGVITVTINRSQNAITGYTVEGHVNFKLKGEDIVCAAVSTLTQTALLGLIQYIAPDYSIHDSTLECHLPKLIEATDRIRVNAILDTMILGLRNIEKNYPGYMEVV